MKRNPLVATESKQDSLPDSGPGTHLALTQSEVEVMERLAKGRLNKEIADELGVSFSVVHKHQHNIFRKLQVGNRTEAALKWMLTRSQV